MCKHTTYIKNVHIYTNKYRYNIHIPNTKTENGYVTYKRKKSGRMHATQAIKTNTTLTAVLQYGIDFIYVVIYIYTHQIYQYNLMTTMSHIGHIVATITAMSK